MTAPRKFVVHNSSESRQHLFSNGIETIGRKVENMDNPREMALQMQWNTIAGCVTAIFARILTFYSVQNSK